MNSSSVSSSDILRNHNRLQCIYTTYHFVRTKLMPNVIKHNFKFSNIYDTSFRCINGLAYITSFISSRNDVATKENPLNRTCALALGGVPGELRGGLDVNVDSKLATTSSGSIVGLNGGARAF